MTIWVRELSLLYAGIHMYIMLNSTMWVHFFTFSYMHLIIRIVSSEPWARASTGLLDKDIIYINTYILHISGHYKLLWEYTVTTTDNAAWNTKLSQKTKVSVCAVPGADIVLTLSLQKVPLKLFMVGSLMHGQHEWRKNFISCENKTMVKK